MKFPSTLSPLAPLKYCRASTAEHVLKHSSDKPVGRQEKRNQFNHPEYLAIKNTVSMGWTVTNKSHLQSRESYLNNNLLSVSILSHQTHSRVIRKSDSFYHYQGEKKGSRYDVKKHRKLKENVRCHGDQEPEAGGQSPRATEQELEDEKREDRTRSGGMSQREQLWR